MWNSKFELNQWTSTFIKNEKFRNKETKIVLDIDVNDKEIHQLVTFCKPVPNWSYNSLFKIILYHSSWFKLMKSVSWLLKFRSYLTSKSSKHKSNLYKMIKLNFLIIEQSNKNLAFCSKLWAWFLTSSNDNFSIIRINRS